MARRKARAMQAFVDDLAAATIEEFGGSKGIAQKLRDVYEMSTGAVKGRTLDIVVKLISQSVATSEADDAMTEDDLEQEAREIASELGRCDSPED